MNANIGNKMTLQYYDIDKNVKVKNFKNVCIIANPIKLKDYNDYKVSSSNFNIYGQEISFEFRDALKSEIYDNYLEVRGLPDGIFFDCSKVKYIFITKICQKESKDSYYWASKTKVPITFDSTDFLLVPKKIINL